MNQPEMRNILAGRCHCTLKHIDRIGNNQINLSER